MNEKKEQNLETFIIWHLGYVLYVSIFFFFMYEMDLFKAYWIFKEVALINVVAPAHTLVFVLICPFRSRWRLAIATTWHALDHEPLYTMMAGLILLIGFYLYSLLIWVVGGLIPAIIYS